MRRIFAANFGANNTCLYWINPDAPIPVCTALSDPGGEPSGYAIRQNGKIELALGLYGLHYEELKKIREFHFNMRQVPSEKNRKYLTNYFRMWRERIMKERAKEFENLDESYWFIACPTGAEWKSKEVRNLYREIFEDAGFRNVYIVPEYIGTLAYFEKTNNVLKECGSDKKLFQIDLGAYSISATPYFGKSTGTSYEKYLGASLIERMILHAILYGGEQKFRKGNIIINMPETLEVARKSYENPQTHEKFSSYMLSQTRELKEKYFTDESKGTLPHGNLTFNSGFFVGQGDDKEELILFTNPKMMKILMEETPIREVLGEEFYTLKKEVIDYVGNLTWMDALRKFLGELGKEYKVADKGANAVIMLTGECSLMKCVYDEVKKFFPDAKIHYDPQAISAIGQGIAYWAIDKIKATDFQKRFRRFCKSELENVIIPTLTEAFKDCVSDISHDVATEERDAVNFGINQWKTYNCHSTYIPDKIELHFKSWCTNKNVATFISKLENRVNNLKVRLNEDFNNEVLSPLNMMTGTPQDDIFLKVDDKISFPVSKELFEHVINFLTQQIIDYYKRNDIWQNFPNPSDGFFTNPRRSFYNDNATVLNNWLDNNTGTTSALCEKYFCEDNLPKVDLTFINFFMLEVQRKLENLLEEKERERVNAILGRLVLKELLEDDFEDDFEDE